MISRDDKYTINTGRSSGELLAHLRTSILDGRLAPGSFLPTVRKLSRQQGVAHNTAWRALRALEQEGLVVSHPRRGYRVLPKEPERRAPLAYVLSRENIFGGWDLFYRKLLEAFEAGAHRRGAEVTKWILSPGEERLLQKQLEQAACSGLVVDSTPPKLLDWARRKKLNVVVVDDWRQDLACDAVVQNNFAGGELAAQHLLAQGCRRLAWFGKDPNHHHAQARLGGALASLAAAGRSFAFRESWPLEGGELQKKAMEVLGRTDRPDGILALWRPMTEALVQAARRLGLTIGKDLHLIGWIVEEAIDEGYLPLFDGGPVGPTITWKAADMAETALALLANRLMQPKLPPHGHLLPVRLQTFA